MKICLLALLTLMAAAACALAQPPDTLWARTYGGVLQDGANAICQTADGGFLATGYFEASAGTNYDLYVVRTSGDGDTLWTRRFGGSGNDFGRGVRQTSDGGFLVIGNTTSFGHASTDLWLLRLSSLGDTVWTRFYGGSGYENPKAIEPLADGNFVIAGYSSSFGSIAGEGFALKIGLDGDTLWTRHYGGEGEQDFAAVTPLTDGGFVFAGYTTPQDLPGADVYVVRTDAAGDTLWTRRYGTPNVQDQAAGVQPMADGGFLVGGFTQATTNSEADFLAISISATGALRWSHTYGGSGWDRAYALRRATDGNFVLAGITHSFGAGNHDGYLIKVDGDGDTLWTVTCGGPGNEYLYSLEVTHDGGYIVAGFTNSFGWGGSDGYVVRYPGFSGVGGFVHDETTGDPLPNVWVSAIGQTQSALTDAAGHYVLTLPPDTTFDIITYGQCTENDTVWNVAIFEDSIAALDLTVGRPHGIVTQSSLNIIAPNHQSGVDTLFISNTGPGILDFRVVVRALAPPSPWRTNSRTGRSCARG